jgi:hypothetical protein
MTATNNRLTYTGLTPTTGKLLGTFTVDSGNNVAISFYLAKNGIVIPASKSIVRVSAGADTRAGTVSTLTSLVTGDFIEIWAENNTNTDDLTCLFLNLNIIG